MSGWWSIIDDAIQKAMEEGAFENLAGSGRPLNLYTNPHEDPTMRSANRIMEQHGIAPDWIMERQSVIQAIEKARADVQRAWDHYQTQPGSRIPSAKAHWDKAAEKFRQAVIALNQRILTYNLKAPDTSVHIPPLVWEHELQRVQHQANG